MHLRDSFMIFPWMRNGDALDPTVPLAAVAQSKHGHSRVFKPAKQVIWSLGLRHLLGIRCCLAAESCSQHRAGMLTVTTATVGCAGASFVLTAKAGVEELAYEAQASTSSRVIHCLR